MNYFLRCAVGSCLHVVVLVLWEPEEMMTITQILKLLLLLTKFSSFSISLALRARDVGRIINKGRHPNVMRGFMAANHPPVLTSSERRPAKQGL